MRNSLLELVNWSIDLNLRARPVRAILLAQHPSNSHIQQMSVPVLAATLLLHTTYDVPWELALMI